MCNFLSGVVRKDGVFFFLKNSQSHSDIVRHYGFTNEELESGDVILFEVYPVRRFRIEGCILDAPDWVKQQKIAKSAIGLYADACTEELLAARKALIDYDAIVGYRVPGSIKGCRRLEETVIMEERRAMERIRLSDTVHVETYNPWQGYTIITATTV
jgi:hypothetical protein